ncbi:hypothetical protein LWC34_18880 [Kibdelosporangium philippinense]|uniref:Uncharacterized protein n=1 Tax=Kibdelosporangium philippinense TaxID=211113 RepID=A0ABS8ZCW5_9PSEU|nr:hypothetical protein [Kibdelosporangium philippinense]MCE7004873.1 hypothetical protein [Kibdelosporangium philippinense]
MIKTMGRIAAGVAAVGIMFGAAGTAWADWIYIGSYPSEERCEAEAVKYRSSDVGAKCYYDRGHAEWDLMIWSIGG